MYLVGEAAHGLDYYENDPDDAADDFWYCGFGNHSGAPLLTFLLREATNEHGATTDWYPDQLTGHYLDPNQIALIPLVPTSTQRTFVNSGGTTFPDDYTEIDNSDLKFFLYQPVDGDTFIAVMASEVEAKLAGEQGMGDGSPDRDNGLRIDIAFRASFTLATEKFEFLKRLDDNTVAYPTMHPGDL